MSKVFVCLFFFLLAPSFVLAGMNGPKITKQQTQPPEPSFPAKAAQVGIRFFQLAISPLDGPRSPSYPTGSAYGRQAIKKHGAFWGIILTADRLIHESDQPLGPIIYLYGKERYYDPVEQNDFWLLE